MLKNEIKEKIISLRQEFQFDKLHTIWEIFSEENDIDDDDEYVGKIFDEMVESGEIDLNVQEFRVKILKSERIEKLKKLDKISKRHN